MAGTEGGSEREQLAALHAAALLLSPSLTAAVYKRQRRMSYTGTAHCYARKHDWRLGSGAGARSSG
jgi:hypothetical protein